MKRSRWRRTRYARMVLTVASASVALAMIVDAPVWGKSDAGNINSAELQNLLRVKIRTVQHMALNPVLVRAVRRQNAEKLTLAEIKKRDKEWVGTKELTPFKLSLQTNKAGEFLKATVLQNNSFNEAFLTDDKGANVAAFPATSDYWQGDEEKWTASFNGGKGKIFIGPLEKDASTQTFAVQVSAPVLDRGETIGVLVVGVKLDYLESKRLTAANR